MEPRLIYIDPELPVAYFSDTDEPWGDDWNDAPYEHNAGYPYLYERRVAYFDTNMVTPRDNTINSEYSVELINKGAIAWLRTPTWENPIVVITAGITVPEFISRIEEAGGIALELPTNGVALELPE